MMRKKSRKDEQQEENEWGVGLESTRTMSTVV